MRILIDECIDERLRLLFPGYDCQTARFANLAGLKNGRLLEAAEADCTFRTFHFMFCRARRSCENQISGLLTAWSQHQRDARLSGLGWLG